LQIETDRALIGSNLIVQNGPDQEPENSDPETWRLPHFVLAQTRGPIYIRDRGELLIADRLGDAFLRGASAPSIFDCRKHSRIGNG